MDRAIIIPNITDTDVRIKRIFKQLADNAISAKTLSMSIFELAMRTMLHSCGYVWRSDIVMVSLRNWARDTSPSYGIWMTPDEVDGIIDEQFDLILFAYDEISKQVIDRIKPIILKDAPLRRFAEVKFYYNVPSEGSITMHLLEYADR